VYHDLDGGVTMSRRIIENAGRGLAVGVTLAGVGYAALVVLSRIRYGRGAGELAADRSELLDRFIPVPEVVEHHRVRIAAPPAVALAAATEMRLLSLPLVRAVIRVRELALGGRPDTGPHPEALLAQMQSIGWVVVAERPGNEIALGAATQPWHAAPVFRSIPGGDFVAFSEPGYVKIVWSLRAEPVGEHATRFHTETRVCTTDFQSRKRFRRYWSYVAPGVGLIRLAMLRPLKKEAERRAAALTRDGARSPARG
jgi:hypothetical protein